MTSVADGPKPLPWAPEPLAALRERYPAAVVKVWSTDMIDAFAEEGLPFDRPTIHREHVFDTEVGLRLAISTEFTRGQNILHVSASLHDLGGASSAERELTALPKPPSRARIKRFLAIAEGLIAEITGRFDLALLGMTRSVFHWTAPLEEKR